MMTPELQLALGKLFRMLSRPYEPGDDDAYNKTRGIILDASTGMNTGYQPTYARDWNKGAHGDAS